MHRLTYATFPLLLAASLAACDPSSSNLLENDPGLTFIEADAGEAMPLLQVVPVDPARGRVTSAPAGIDCGTDCRERYLAGQAVTLTATPAPGMAFERWVDTAGCGTRKTCTITLDRSRWAEASFKPGHLLHVDRPAVCKGSPTRVYSIPAGIDCSVFGGPCDAELVAGTVTLVPRDVPGCSVLWLGCDRVVGGRCEVTLDADASVRVVYHGTGETWAR